MYTNMYQDTLEEYLSSLESLDADGRWTDDHTHLPLLFPSVKCRVVVLVRPAQEELREV